MKTLKQAIILRRVKIFTPIAAILIAGYFTVYYLSKSGYDDWIQLFNGSTWPQIFTEASPPSTTRGSTFYIVLYIRTVINLGIMLAIPTALIGAFTDDAKEWVMSKFASILTTRDTALTAYLITKLLEANENSLSNEQSTILYNAAKDFKDTAAGKHFMEYAKQAMAGNLPKPHK